MDDRNFDDYIKRKLDNYEDPAFDPGALAAFREQMASYHPAPWYEAHLTHYLVAASLTLFTVVNAWLFWPRGEVHQTAAGQASSINADSVRNEMERVNVSHQLVVDSLMRIIEGAKQQISLNETAHPETHTPNPEISSVASLGPVSGFSGEALENLKSRGLVEVKGNEVFLLTSGTNAGSRKYAAYPEISLANNYHDHEINYPPFKLAAVETLQKSTNKNTVSAKTRAALEKHYFKGLGVAIAPHLDFLHASFSQGGGSVQPRAGVLVDLILSPRLSVESGITYGQTRVSFERDSAGGPLLPGAPPAYDRAQIVNSLISTPVGLKYRQWISEKTQGLLKVGYTPYFTLAQEYSYTYDFDYGPYSPGPGYPPNRHHITTVEKYADNGFYGGTVTVAAGLTRLIKPNTKLEASLFYEKSLAGVGKEDLGMQMIGLRTAYWFTLR